MIACVHVPRGNQRSIDYHKTQTWEWTLTARDLIGAAKIVGAFHDYSLQCSGPVLIEASNNAEQWFRFVEVTQAGLLHLPFPVLAIRPIATAAQTPVVVTLFLLDR